MSAARTLTALLVPFSLLGFAVFMLWTVAAQAQDDAPKIRILAVHAYSQDYAWTAGQHRGFVATLDAGLSRTAHVNSEYLNTKERKLDPAYALAYAAFIAEKYEDQPPTAIYVTDDDGYRFAIDYLREHYPEPPVFFSGVNDFGVRESLAFDMATGVFERQDIARNLDLLAQMAPDTTRVFILGDGSSTFKAIEREIRSDIQDSTGAVSLEVLSGDTLQTALTAIAEQPDDPILLTTIGGMKDGKGNVLDPRETVRRIKTVSQGPIVTMEGAYMVEGVLGGYVTSPERQGEGAANLVLAWLAGTEFSRIDAVLESPNEFVFNGTVMDSLDMRLPVRIEGKTRIVQPVPDFFEQNQDLFLSALVLLSGLLLLATFLLVINMGERIE